MINTTEKVEAFKNGFRKDIKESNDKNKILDYCLMKAWRDAVIRERFNKNSQIISNKNTIMNLFKNEILNNSAAINNNFEFWHKNLCQNSSFGMTYGIWQKFVNMSFKYIYCFQSLFVEINFNQCHCPIDSIIANILYNQIKDLNDIKTEVAYKISKSSHDLNWNNIQHNDYLTFQEFVKNACKKDNITPIEFDFIYWEN